MSPPVESHPRAQTKRGARAGALFASGLLLAGGGIAGFGPTGAYASSHREAPLISGAPQYDNTDVYAFVSPDDPTKTTLIANWIPFEDPSGGPNFYPFATDARYNFNIDRNGDAKVDVRYSYTFTTTYQNGDTFLYNNGPVTSLTDPNLNVRQQFTLTKTVDGKSTKVTTGLVAPSYVGDASMPDYASLRNAAVKTIDNGNVKILAGQADDPFFLDLRIFDLLYGGNFSEIGNDTLAGYNVNTIAMQLPSKWLTGGSDPTVGIWSTTDKKTASGNWQQVSRLGNPLVNEAVIPVKNKDTFNASQPSNDGQFLSSVTDPEVPKLIQAIYGIPAPATPRNDLVQVFLTGIKGLNQPTNLTAPGEELRLNTSIPPSTSPNRLGVIGGDTAGFPNGRRLGDDVVDISLQVLEGELVGSPNDLGDAVNSNDVPFGSHFPYVALPHSGSAVGTSTSTTSSGYTLLNGGSYKGTQSAAFVPSSSSGIPALSISLVALGMLAIFAGATTVRRMRIDAHPAA